MTENQSSTPGLDAEEAAHGWSAELRRQARAEGGRLTAGARDARLRWRGLLRQRQGKLAARLDRCAAALDDAGGRLSEDTGSDVPGDYAGRAARRVEDAARYVRDREPREVARDAADLARRRPLVFLGGSFLAGLLLGRFLKSSGARAARRGNVPDAPPDLGHRGGRGGHRFASQEEQPWQSSTIQ